MDQNIVASDQDVCWVEGYWNGEVLHERTAIPFSEFVKGAQGTIDYIEQVINKTSLTFIILLGLWFGGLTIGMIAAVAVHSGALLVIGLLIAAIPSMGKSFMKTRGRWYVNASLLGNLFRFILWFTINSLLLIMLYPFTIFLVNRDNAANAKYMNSLKQMYQELL